MKIKRFLAMAAAAALSLSLTACGTKQEEKVVVPTLSPDAVLSLDTAIATTGTSLVMSADGVVNNGGMLSCTYVSNPIGAADPVSIGIEQFSDTVTTRQIWDKYEDGRVYREDMEFVQGIGEDCYIAYPFICVYDRGCYIRISAGSGNTEEQKNLLINLAKAAAASVEASIPAEAVTQSAAEDNVIQ